MSNGSAGLALDRYKKERKEVLYKVKLLSVAIPCYNSEAYMRHCIDTLLTGGDEVEILIVDDGSTKDRTPEIADEYEKNYNRAMFDGSYADLL